ncbi:unnamed protein product (macronuclear) [Paramecium tetraurelia]|uniref:Uncharacterized protein n=1 Tax=Paramecium tetraurelia TaxID=5888 RepID=A0DSB2_PARTE|nr:uncharacterized protein GSPATT00019633001 [Paramecium tetraurelia]CAK85929.1 unnamed protein product [Paramecium tetraurelia]|eukprot:XP_001453326.1 hypothetical protein (macronuclear) [Paramecium tetraurelia strain d4-2]
MIKLFKGNNTLLAQNGTITFDVKRLDYNCQMYKNMQFSQYWKYSNLSFLFCYWVRNNDLIKDFSFSQYLQKSGIDDFYRRQLQWMYILSLKIKREQLLPLENNFNQCAIEFLSLLYSGYNYKNHPIKRDLTIEKRQETNLDHIYRRRIVLIFQSKFLLKLLKQYCSNSIDQVSGIRFGYFSFI